MRRKGLSLVTVLALLLCCMAEGKFALAFFHDDDAPHALELIAGQAVLHHGDSNSEPEFEAFSDHHGADHELDCACSTLAKSPAGFEVPALLTTFWHEVPTVLPLFRRRLTQGSETIRRHPTPIYLRHQTLLV